MITLTAEALRQRREDNRDSIEAKAWASIEEAIVQWGAEMGASEIEITRGRWAPLPRHTVVARLQTLGYTVDDSGPHIRVSW